MTAVTRPPSETLAMLRHIGIIPVVRCDAADIAVRVAEVLFDTGLLAVEITMTVPNALDAISQLSRRGGPSRPVIGAGTVLTAEAARAAVEAGAEFLVSPAVLSDVIDIAKRAGVAVIPGALTPSEILWAVHAGADLIKIFPAQAVGGPSYIRALRGPFPDLPLVPTGGVDLHNVGGFIRAGATAVGVGSELVSRDELARGDYGGIASRARQFMAAIAAARSEQTGAGRAREA